jgi:sulfatase maturation enzyme AslB (radical SAM superfamily)
LIKKEFKTLGIPIKQLAFTNTPFNKINFNTVERIYLGGGEPTVMPEFYEFLRQCIENKSTNFELQIGTNGMKYSDTLLNLLDNFSQVCFSTSFDGFKEINDYIRWKSNFDVIVANSRIARKRGHVVSLQTVYSMYNATRLHTLFDFFDKEFPESSLLVQVANGFDDIFLPYNHPCPDMVIESMKKCKETKIYYSNGRSLKSMIDLMLDYYQRPDYTVDVVKLKKFYDYNDKLDQSRGSKLKDYIPELAEARKIYNL